MSKRSKIPGIVRQELSKHGFHTNGSWSDKHKTVRTRKIVILEKNISLEVRAQIMADIKAALKVAGIEYQTAEFMYHVNKFIQPYWSFRVKTRY